MHLNHTIKFLTLNNSEELYLIIFEWDKAFFELETFNVKNIEKKTSKLYLFIKAVNMLNKGIKFEETNTYKEQDYDLVVRIKRNIRKEKHLINQ